jgi:polyisoprenoid-binding protein YceI
LIGLCAALLLAAPTAVLAGPVCPPGLPPGVGCGGKDLAAATAGTYALDPNHDGIIARISHLGYSYSIFRFGKAKGDLTWDPAAPAASKLSVTVQTASIETNVEGFAEELAGDRFLKSKAFPEATFVSTAFRPTDATHGEVDGQFTLMGKTAPATFKVELVGAGVGFGKPRLGVHAATTLDPKSYGLPPVFNQPIDLVIDAEFERQP